MTNHHAFSLSLCLLDDNLLHGLLLVLLMCIWLAASVEEPRVSQKCMFGRSVQHMCSVLLNIVIKHAAFSVIGRKESDRFRISALPLEETDY